MAPNVGNGKESVANSHSPFGPCPVARLGRDYLFLNQQAIDYPSNLPTSRNRNRIDQEPHFRTQHMPAKLKKAPTAKRTKNPSSDAARPPAARGRPPEAAISSITKAYGDGIIMRF